MLIHIFFLIFSILITSCSHKFRTPSNKEKRKILVILSSARKIPLASPNRDSIPAGFYLVELGKMLREFQGTHQFTFATPDGVSPQIDINGLDLDFHVQGAKAPIFNTKTNLGFLWRENFPKLSSKPEDFINRFRQKRPEEIDHRTKDINAAMELMGKLDISEPIHNTNPEVLDIHHKVTEGFNRQEEKKFYSLREILNRDNDVNDQFKLNEFDFVYLPGGHGPMVDLADNPYLGEILNRMHENQKLIVAICHGPIGLRSAIYRIDKNGKPIKNLKSFALKGAKITTVSSFEESLMLRIGYIRAAQDQSRTKLEYFVDDALKAVGYEVKYGSPLVKRIQFYPGKPKVIYDDKFKVLTSNGPQAVDELVEKLLQIY